METEAELVAESALHFVETLRLTHRFWGIQIPGNTKWQSREIWAFRGQRDANWDLVPSAFRPTTILGYRPESTAPSLLPARQPEQEIQVMKDFLFVADRVGLRIPGDGHHFRLPRNLGTAEDDPPFDWPWPHALETLAIAQHHGIPTRLLDFTHAPLTAGYFACYDAWSVMGKPPLSEELSDDRMLAVWAIHLPIVFESVTRAKNDRNRPRVILVTAPRATNSFLHHQDGFFMVDLEADQYGYPTLNSVISKLSRSADTDGHGSKPPIKKLLLRYEHVPSVLAHYWNEFHHKARIQPTYDNVTQALEDYRQLYR